MKITLISLILMVIVITGCSTPRDLPAVTGIPRIDTGVDLNSWVTIPAGEFFFGQHMHPTMVDYDYEIMVTDVTNQQYAEYLSRALADGSISLQGNQISGYYH